MTRRQCDLCPWKVTTDPHEIPGGYDEAKHRALVSTIAEPGAFDSIGKPLRVMACHESDLGNEVPCVGWLVNQMGDGNNIALRYAISRKKISADVETVGEQHACLEDTFPKTRSATEQERVQAGAEALWETYRHRPFDEQPKIVQRAFLYTMRKLWRAMRTIE